MTSRSSTPILRRVAIFCAVLACAIHVPRLSSAAVEEAEAKANKKRPNILFIYTDDQPYKTVGCYPEAPDWVKTPNIDRLAEQGIRFPRCYLGAWCMPSRAMLLTGRMQHGIESMRMEGTYPASTYDPKLTPFWPAELRKQGYQTAQIGKWHTGTDTGMGRDWDYQIVWNRPGHPENAGAYYKGQIVTFNGEDREVKGYSTDNYTDWAIDYMTGKDRDPEKPFYLWLCYGAVHGPTTPADRHKGAYAGKKAVIPADIVGERPDKPAYLNKTQAWVLNKDGKPVMKTRPKREGNFDTDEPGLDFHAWVQQVNECALALDEAVGRLVATLKKNGELENTLIVFAGDQGYGVGEHGFSQKQAPYEATLASPLIITHPGTLPAGKVCNHPVNSSDLVATFLAQAEVSVPWKLHGRDLSALLRNPEHGELSGTMMMEHMGANYGSATNKVPVKKEFTEPGSGNVPWWVMIRDGKYKYIRNLVEGEVEEIYDLEADPEELVNLAVKEKHRKLLESLRSKAIAELQRTEAGFIDSMPLSRQMLK